MDQTDRGESLLELLVALVIMSVAVVAIAGSITAAVLYSDVHRKQATASAYLRDYAEAVEAAVAAGGYTASCSPNYAAAYTAPAGYTPAITAVSFWNGTSFPATCSAAGEQGVQRLTLQVRSTDGRAAESLALVLRRPCGPGSSCT
jgi:Tfp pilus assembly protein PilV